MLYNRFYSEIGKLLYAVADIDHVITKEEKKALQKIVAEELVPAEKRKDKYGTDLAYYTEFEFDFLDEEIIDSQAAFQSFIDFVDEFHDFFDDRMKKVCLRITKEIAKSYRGISRRENVLIKKLRKSMEKLEKKPARKKSQYMTRKEILQ